MQSSSFPGRGLNCGQTTRSQGLISCGWVLSGDKRSLINKLGQNVALIGLCATASLLALKLLAGAISGLCSARVMLNLIDRTNGNDYSNAPLKILDE